jgi:hypothetical protein
MDATQIVKDALDANPDMRLVLEIAARAHELEQMQPPKNLWVNTEIVTLGYPVQPET